MSTTTCACLGCEEPPAIGGQNKKFCSSSCYNWSRRYPKKPRPPRFRECATLGCDEPLPTLHARAKYCSDACARWARKRPGEPIPPAERDCLACGERLVKRTRVARFCSNACQQAHERGAKGRLKPRNVESTCKCCGLVFLASRSDAKWCSIRCGNWGRKHPGEPVPDSVVGCPPPKAQRMAECEVCGEEFRQMTKAHRYCTDRCRRRSNRGAKPSLYRERLHRRRALLKSVRSGDGEALAMFWDRAVTRSGGYCFYCGSKPDRLTVDHIVPLSRGGHDTIGNRIPACLSCNSSKGAKTFMEWRMTGNAPVALTA